MLGLGVGASRLSPLPTKPTNSQSGPLEMVGHPLLRRAVSPTGPMSCRRCCVPAEPASIAFLHASLSPLDRGRGRSGPLSGGFRRSGRVRARRRTAGTARHLRPPRAARAAVLGADAVQRRLLCPGEARTQAKDPTRGVSTGERLGDDRDEARRRSLRPEIAIAPGRTPAHPAIVQSGSCSR
jgi:hypothetical protein